MSAGPWAPSSVTTSLPPPVVNLQGTAVAPPFELGHPGHLELRGAVELDPGEVGMERAQGVGDSAADFLLLGSQGQLGLDVLDVEVANSLFLPWRGRFCERPALWGRPAAGARSLSPGRAKGADT